MSGSEACAGKEYIEELEQFTIQPGFWRRRYKVLIAGIIAVVIIVILGWQLHWHKWLIALGVLIVSVFSQLFTFFVGLVNLIPGIGHHLARVISLPVVWFLNGLAYILALFAVLKGKSLHVVRVRLLVLILVITFALGMAVGFWVRSIK